MSFEYRYTEFLIFISSFKTVNCVKIIIKLFTDMKKEILVKGTYFLKVAKKKTHLLRLQVFFSNIFIHRFQK